MKRKIIGLLMAAAVLVLMGCPNAAAPGTGAGPGQYTLTQIVDEFGLPVESPGEPVVFNDLLYFSGIASTEGLFYLDSAGVAQLAFAGYIRDAAVFKGALFFGGNPGTSGTDLYTWDGINPPTLIRDFTNSVENPSYDIVYRLKVSLVGGQEQLYMVGSDTATGYEIWRYTGTGSVQQVSDLSAANETYPISDTANRLIGFDNRLFFAGHGITSFTDVYVHDGNAGLATVAFGSLDASFNPFAVFNGELFFISTHGTTGWEWWHYDGTNTPTLLADINTSGDSNPIYQSVVLNRLLFQADDGTGSGIELWQYDGINPPSMVADLNPLGDGAPHSYAVMDGKVYFTAVHATKGREVWVWDTISGPEVAFELNDGGDSFPNWPTPWVFIRSFLGALYIAGDDGTGKTLWRYGP